MFDPKHRVRWTSGSTEWQMPIETCAALVALWPLLLPILLGECFGDFDLNADDHPCSVCAECQTCVQVFNGRAICRAEPQSEKGCGSDGMIRWFDSCGAEGEVFLDCQNGGACQVQNDGDAACVCVRGWSGEQCDVCLETAITVDGKCESCEPGTYDDDGNPWTACVSVSNCAANQYERTPPTASRDRQCAQLTQCTATQYESIAPTATSDRQCSDVTQCTATQYEIAAPTGTSDRQCTNVTACDPGEYQTSPPTATSDRQCAALTPCTESQYESVAATPTSDRQCTEVSDCGPGEYQTSPPTATSDRQCAQVTECDNSQYEVAPPTTSSNRQCADVTVCGPGEYQTSPPTAVGDRLCAPCENGTYSYLNNLSACFEWSICSTGEYESVAPTATNDRECADLTNCKQYQYEVAPPTSTSDRQCADLSECTESQYEAVAPTETSDRQCEDATVCRAGEYQTLPLTATSDRECAACETGTYSATDNASSCSPWTECAPGDVEVTPGTATSDRTCRWWVRQLGGSIGSYDLCYSADVDGNGNVLVAGDTSDDLDGEGRIGGTDAYVIKLSETDGTVMWTEQFGTVEEDHAWSVRVDGDGNLLVAGYTSGDLDGEGNLGDWDAYAMKLSGTDHTVLWTEQYGTSADDYARSVSVDGDGDVLVAGYTSGDFDGEGNLGNWDAYVMKLSGTDHTILWTEQFGTSADDQARSVSVDSDGNVFVAGYTYGDLDGEGNLGGGDSYVMKLSGTDGTILWIEQFGVSGSDEADSVTVDRDDNVLVAGSAYGNLDGEGNAGGRDAYAMKLSGTAGTVMWAQQFGTSADEYAYSVSVDGDSNVLAAGGTYGDLTGEGNWGARDAYVTKLSGTDGTIVWTEQLGTSAHDYVMSVSGEGDDNVILAGTTYGELGVGTNAGSPDVFVLRLPQ